VTDPGSLNTRLVIEAPVETPDGAGGVARAYEDQATVWAAVVPLSAAPAIEAGRAEAAVTHRVVIRRGPELTTQHRLRANTRVFRILAFRDSDARGRFVEISAQERAG
jgi:SPP1 family predicted phage head-tail adaptor